MLTSVTITGADDGVDPLELASLSAEYPFVEWGILYSTTRAVTPRYPSIDWIAELRAVRPEMELSAHFCGRFARDVLAGAPDALAKAYEEGFHRVQINGFERTAAFERLMAKAGNSRLLEIVLQVGDPAQLPRMVEFAAETSCSVLFDASGGTGVAPGAWPVVIPPEGTKIGYAGGIGPENVDRVVAELYDAAPKFWIDMESGVRSPANQFDLARVRAVLRRARYLVGRSAR